MGRCSSSTLHTEPEDEVHYTLTRHLNPSNLIRHRWPTEDRRCVQTSISEKRNLADSSEVLVLYRKRDEAKACAGVACLRAFDTTT